MTEDLGSSIKRGLVWSFANTLVLRLGSLALGIILARLLEPKAFGVFAVALTVQGVLVTLADLGLSADLVRAEDPEFRAPTVATLSLASSVVLAVAMASTAPTVAALLGTESAAPVIAVLSMSVILSGVGVVPYAHLQRNFQQKRLFVSSSADFVVGTAVTLLLVAVGVGPMALAVGRLAAQATATSLQFILAKCRPAFGFDFAVASTALPFGLPLAFANLLSWALLSVDNIVIARTIGAVSLGYYVLAFNISTWPMSAIGYAIRAVSFAAYSRIVDTSPDSARDRSLAVGAGLAWAAGLLAGGLLALLARTLIELTYGAKWLPAAVALTGLGIFGSFRVLFDVMATYLMAKGKSRPVLLIQFIWLVVLVPAMVFSTSQFGLAGAGWAHVAVSVGVVFPAYMWAVSRANADVRALAFVCWPPIAAAVPAAGAAIVFSSASSVPVLSLVLGGLAGTAVYVGLLSRWLLRLRSAAATISASTQISEFDQIVTVGSVPAQLLGHQDVAGSSTSHPHSTPSTRRSKICDGHTMGPTSE